QHAAAAGSVLGATARTGTVRPVTGAGDSPPPLASGAGARPVRTVHRRPQRLPVEPPREHLAYALP
ncbi:hypothetical protein, partial [Streptomyces indiaensis]|uniref:hypothetical protein n=1 Tax=Streptomyces indiaensis TaxID=284033 RepID=UPI0031E1320D